jgi:hypothetical protein
MKYVYLNRSPLKIPLEARNAAVEKAKAWLAENPNWTAKPETK